MITRRKKLPRVLFAGGFGRVLQIDVYGFAAGEGGHVGGDFPVEAGGEELAGQRQKFLEVGGVVDIAGTDFPGRAQSGGEIVVDAAKFKLSHVEDSVLGDHKVESHGFGGVVEFGVGFDGGEDISE